MGTEVIKALLIDEALDNAQAIGRALSQSIYPRIAVVHGDTLLKSLGVLQTGSIDVAVVALSVFENAAFDELTLRFPHCPIVVAAEPEREADAIRALDAGAQDYFVLGQDSRIAARVIGFAAERARLQADLDSARSTLAAGAARLDAITSTTSTAFFAFDREGIVTFAAGDAFTSDLIAAQEMIGKSVFDLYANNAVSIASYRRVLGGEVISTLRPRAAHPEMISELWYIPIYGPDGTIVEAIALALDVTERDRAQIAEREQRTLAEALRDTAIALTSSLDLETVMSEIMSNVGRIVPHDGGSIILLEPDGAYVAYSEGYGDDARRLFQTLRLPHEMFNFRTMAQTGQPLLIAHTEVFPGWVKIDSLDWVRSFVGAPMSARGETIGFLCLDSATNGFFTETHAERLGAFAPQAAIAMQNARLFATVQRDAHELEALNRATSLLYTPLIGASSLLDVAQQIAEAVVKGFGKVDCGVGLLGEDDHITRLAHAGEYQVQPGLVLSVEGPGLVSSAIRDAEIVYASDVDKDARYVRGEPRTRSEFVVPLKTPRGVIGILDMQSDELDAFRELDRRVMVAFAERAAVAIENVRLYEQTLSYADTLERSVWERTLALEAERAQLQAILNSMGEGVIYWETQDGRPQFKYVNQAFCRLTGYTFEEIARLDNFHEQLIGDSELSQQIYAPVSESINASGIWRGEIQYRRKDGNYVDTYVTVTGLDNHGSGLLGGVALLRDISQEKQLQRQRSQFITNASHELRTPIASFRLRSYLLARQPERLTEHLRVLELVTNRMENLVEDLFDVARFEQGTIQLNRAEIDLCQLIHDVILIQEPFAVERSIQFLSDLPDQPLVILADPNRLTQVFINLITNAINYSPAEGRVKISVSDAQPDGERQAIIRVQDSATGTTPEALPQVFEPFARPGDGTMRGTGLGLAIAHEIVKLHGGMIAVEGQPDIGTTFTVTLPVQSVEPAASRQLS